MTLEELASGRASSTSPRSSAPSAAPHPGIEHPADRSRSHAPPTACSSTGFGFAEAAALAPYLASLGVSHVYASPYLMARRAARMATTSSTTPSSTPSSAATRILRRAWWPRSGSTASARSLTSCRTTWASAVRQSRGGWTCSTGVRDSDFAGWFDIDWDPDRALPAGQTAGPLPGRAVRCGLERARSNSVRCGSRQLRRLGLRHPQAADLPAALRAVLGDDHPDLERLGDAFAHPPNGPPIVRAGPRISSRSWPNWSRETRSARSRSRPQSPASTATTGELESWSGAGRADPGSALARRPFPRRSRRHQLPPLLQHQRPGRDPHGAPAALRPCASPGVPLAPNKERSTDSAWITSMVFSIRKGIVCACGKRRRVRSISVVEKILAPP